MAVGAVLTAVLAALTGFGLVGLAVVLVGAALTVSARHQPARTRAGAGLLGQLEDLRAFLRSVPAERIATAQRELLFSRCLPYAVVLGEHDHWLGSFADLDPDADGVPGLYWFGGRVELDLRGFADRFPVLLAALTSAWATPRFGT